MGSSLPFEKKNSLKGRHKKEEGLGEEHEKEEWLYTLKGRKMQEEIKERKTKRN
jgi:hypothetical protein